MYPAVARSNFNKALPFKKQDCATTAIYEGGAGKLSSAFRKGEGGRGFLEMLNDSREDAFVCGMVAGTVSHLTEIS